MNDPVAIMVGNINSNYYFNAMNENHYPSHTHTVQLGEMVNDATHRCYTKISPVFRNNPDNLRLYIPLILQRYWLDYVAKMGYQSELKSWRGIQILPGYENRIVIAHVDAVLYKGEGVFSEAISGVEFKIEKDLG